MNKSHKFLSGQDSKRTFKPRNPRISFFCPLCRHPRGFLYGSKLSPWNYLQLVVGNVLLVMLLYPWLKERSLIVIFFTWSIFEVCRKVLYRKEIPCPHCGFDATWYRNDVTKAKKLVKDFWSEQRQTLNPVERPGPASASASASAPASSSVPTPVPVTTTRAAETEVSPNIGP